MTYIKNNEQCNQCARNSESRVCTVFPTYDACCQPEDQNTCKYNWDYYCGAETHYIASGKARYLRCPPHLQCGKTEFSIDNEKTINLRAKSLPSQGSCAYNIYVNTYDITNFELKNPEFSGVEVHIFSSGWSSVKSDLVYKGEYDQLDGDSSTKKLNVEALSHIFILVLPSSENNGEFSLDFKSNNKEGSHFNNNYLITLICIPTLLLLFGVCWWQEIRENIKKRKENENESSESQESIIQDGIPINPEGQQVYHPFERKDIGEGMIA
ncbi:unnamed protein product [Moneuplotes crassus]|uniref:Uncharacterized protein n=1 Tax=Euplotes crassus TaxID=5936 RepID=A0AAD2D050_EUPCR|nr:unnamed protein product [Moneuplotes crassus]